MPIKELSKEVARHSVDVRVEEMSREEGVEVELPPEQISKSSCTPVQLLLRRFVVTLMVRPLWFGRSSVTWHGARW